MIQFLQYNFPFCFYFLFTFFLLNSPAASNSGPSLQVVPSDVAVVITEEIEPTEQREINDTEPVR